MDNKDDKDKAWKEILSFWFPEDRLLTLDVVEHRNHWFWRMRGGADDLITERFSDLTTEVASGRYDDWASSSKGRLALIIVMDQFSRSLWRESARAFAQDPAALALTMEGLSNGHYETLSTPWQKIVFGLPLGHCEGADHLDRMDLLIELREKIAAQAPSALQPIYVSLIKQARDVRQVIATFGRHPHRNRVLGRQSTPSEKAYIMQQQFPHLRAFDG